MIKTVFDLEIFTLSYQLAMDMFCEGLLLRKYLKLRDVGEKT